jgi:hypothetical protein
MRLSAIFAPRPAPRSDMSRGLSLCVHNEASRHAPARTHGAQKCQLIPANSPQRDAWSGSLSSWEKRYLVTDEGAFSMETHRSLRYMIMWSTRPHGKHRREPPPGVARTQATRGIVIPALVIASLGGAAATVAGQTAGDHAQTNAHAATQALAPSSNRPWIY